MTIGFTGRCCCLVLILAFLALVVAPAASAAEAPRLDGALAQEILERLDGDPGAAGADRQRTLLSSMADPVLICIFLLAALYQLYSYLLLRRPVALWFGLLSLAFTGFTLLDSPWIWELTSDPALVLRLRGVFAHLITAFFPQFLWLFFRRTPGRMLRLYMLSHGVVAAAVLVVPSIRWVLVSEPWRWLWIVPCVVIVAWIGVDSLRRRHPEALTVGLGSLAAVAVGAAQVLGHVLGWEVSRMPEASWGFLVFVGFFATALVRRSARLTRDLDAANRQLATRVAENQAALDVAQHRYRTLVDINPVAVFLTTTEGKLLDVNRAFVELFRFTTRREALGLDSATLFAEPQRRHEIIERHRRGDTVHGEEIEMVRRDGSHFWTLLSEAPTLRAGAGEGSGGLLEATLVDVSEQRRARRALEESELRYRRLVESSPGLICSHDMDGRLLSVNPAAARLLGVPAEEMEGNDLRRHLDPEVVGEVDAYLQEIRQEGEASGLVRVRSRRGDSRLVLFRATVIEEPGGRPFVLGFGQDVSDLKEAESELRTSLEAMRDLNRIAAAPGLSLRERVSALLDLGRERFRLDSGVFCRHQGDGNEMVVTRGPVLLSEEGASGHPCEQLYAAARKGRAVASERVGRTEGSEPLTIGGRSVGCLLASPVRVGGRRAGVLAFFDPAPRERSFDAGEVEFLKLMALWVGAQIEQQQRTTDAGRLAEMSELLQSCGSLEEAYEVVAKLAAQFFPEFGGSLLIETRDRGLVETADWGGAAREGRGSFTSADCWAARRGREHWVEESSTGLVCRHVVEPAPASFLCVPMMAMGDLVGVLHLWPRDEETRLIHADRRLAASVAEHSALALANLELREDLRRQSIHDPLTGLFNRRHLDRRLLEECRRVTRTLEPLSVLLLDIDGFKAFNDTYGHQAGDRCLRRVAEVLQQRLRRSGDLVARYGGEEFVAVLPGTDAARAALLAEEVRCEIESLALPNTSSPFGVVTVSIGAETWLPRSPDALEPDALEPDALEPDALVAAADRALYEAKAGGRNQVISSETV